MKSPMARALRAEWTKLRSVRSTSVALFALLALSLLLTVASSNGNHYGYGGPSTYDSSSFVHRPTAGDGTFTVRVASQKHSAPWAKAGLLLKDGTASGSSYAALMVTPGHGVRMMADGKHELTGSGSAGTPRWLRLVRAGDRATGYDSADGRTWHRIGTLTVTGLPATAEAGLFVTSPPTGTEQRTGPSQVSMHPVATVGRAVFDHVDFPASPGTGGWRQADIAQAVKKGEMPDPTADPSPYRERDGVFTVTGSGDLGGLGMGGVGQLGGQPDLVKMTLDDGIQIATIAVIALGVLSVTSEYRTGTARTTFTASPRRDRVLAAKALVLGAVVFAVGLAASVAEFYVALPALRDNGFAPPLFPEPSLTDPSTVRAVVGSAAFLALVAVLGMGVGALLRRAVPAVVLMIVTFIVLPIVAQSTSIGFSDFVGSATPTAGLAIQQTRQLIDTVMTPWAGFGVLCLYVAVVLGAARWRLTGRDV
ncbi:ABC transporter permease subunit [Streptomyces sp. NPDC052225]|uniref:ABC transporter permease subunit n=1 Tax=Streptomyces sp. NPDC052225 TaxID=3154949 RepID=UPI00342002AD